LPKPEPGLSPFPTPEEPKSNYYSACSQAPSSGQSLLATYDEEMSNYVDDLLDDDLHQLLGGDDDSDTTMTSSMMSSTSSLQSLMKPTVVGKRRAPTDNIQVFAAMPRKLKD